MDYIEPKPGQVWRGRLVLDGPAQYASADLIANTLKAAGAANVWVWKDPDAKSFPKDWPDNKKADIAGFLEVMWFVQIQYGGDVFSPQQKFPTSGQNWRIHDAWVYVDSAAPPPVDPKEPVIDPTDPVDPGDIDEWNIGEPTPVPKESTPGDIGDYAGRPATQLDIWAPRVIRAAYMTVMGVYPSPQALQAIQAVGRQEGWYGWAGKPPQWAGHHNWGAITCRCPCGFESKDGYYVNGKWQPYTTCFAHRDTNLEGAIHLVEVLILKRPAVQDVMDSGNLTDFARAMRDTTYFCRTTAKGKDGKPCCSCASDAQKQADAVWYAKMLDSGCNKISKYSGLPQVCFLNGPDPTDPKEPKEPKDPVGPEPKDPKKEAPPAEYSKAGAAAAVVLTALAVGAGVVIVRRRKRRR